MLQSMGSQRVGRNLATEQQYSLMSFKLPITETLSDHPSKAGLHDPLSPCSHGIFIPSTYRHLTLRVFYGCILNSL